MRCAGNWLNRARPDLTPMRTCSPRLPKTRCLTASAPKSWTTSLSALRAARFCAPQPKPLNLDRQDFRNSSPHGTRSAPGFPALPSPSAPSRSPDRPSSSITPRERITPQLKPQRTRLLWPLLFSNHRRPYPQPRQRQLKRLPLRPGSRSAGGLPPRHRPPHQAPSSTRRKSNPHRPLHRAPQ
jgi:hypothetical protein